MTSRDLMVVPVMQAGPRLWVAAASAGAAAFALLSVFGGPAEAVETAAEAETAFRRDAAVMALRISGIATVVVFASWLIFAGLRRHLVAGSTGLAVGFLILVVGSTGLAFGFLMYGLPGLVRTLYGMPGP